MSLSDYVNVNISATGPGPSAPGFGVGMIAAYHTLGGSKRVMGPYSDLAGLVADGFTPDGVAATGKVWLAASKYFAQNPKPTQLYVGRRANTYQQYVDITPVSLVNGTIYSFNIGANAGVGGHDFTYTIASSPTLATVCTAIAALINAASLGVTADGTSGTVVRCQTSSAAGTLIEYKLKVPASICRIKELNLGGSRATDLTTDLNAIWAENKQWYGFGIDSQTDVEIEAAAAWCEANGSTIFVASTSDTDAADAAVTTDVLSILKSTSTVRSACIFNQYSNMSYGNMAWLAVHLTQTPGSDTWHFNTLATVQADTDVLVPQASVTAVKNKNGTVYTTLANLNLTQGGKAGGGTFMDQTRFVDWLRVTIQLAMVVLLARNNGKVPYTDAGFAMLEQTLKSCLEQGIQAGGLVQDSYKITVPLVASISSVDRLARNVPSLPWTAQLAGAVHSMTINGVASAS